MKLIINADDFGLSKSISDGIINGIKGGYITSTSVMANMPYAEYAIKKALDYDIKCIGLHINLTIGKPIIKNINLVDKEGTFLYNREQIENKNLTYEDAFNEIMAQIEMIETYSDGKLTIDHIDTHHFLFKNNSSIKQAIIDISNSMNIPIRNEGLSSAKCPDVLFEDFTIKNVNLECLKEMLCKYKEKGIVVELMTHPGFIDEYTKSITSYLNRERELDVLKESKKLGLFDEVELISFQQF